MGATPQATKEEEEIAVKKVSSTSIGGPTGSVEANTIKKDKGYETLTEMSVAKKDEASQRTPFRRLSDGRMTAGKVAEDDEDAAADDEDDGDNQNEGEQSSGSPPEPDTN